MLSNFELRAVARRSLKGNWNTSALFTFVFIMIAIVVSSFFAVSSLLNENMSMASTLIGMIVSMPLEYAIYIAFLRLLRGEEIEIEWMFDGYRQQRVWTTCLLRFVYIFLWTLLFFIPGIVKSYSYAMTYYILRDNPDMKNDEAIEQSMVMMKGKKLKLFMLNLSFMGWVFLSIFFTCGIGLLWVIPYMYAAQAAFYEDIKA